MGPVSDFRSRRELPESGLKSEKGALGVELRPFLLGNRISVPMLYIAFIYIYIYKYIYIYIGRPKAGLRPAVGSPIKVQGKLFFRKVTF